MAPSPSSRSVFLEPAFWLGLLGIVLGLVLFVVLFNYAVMPIWTRHDAIVSVPDLKNLPADEAEGALSRAGLEAVYRASQFNPNMAPDVVVEQIPEAGAEAKPGRRVYMYVNESPKALVRMPDVVSLSEGVARPQIREAGLTVGRVEMDSVRTPYENTVTRQLPVAGRQVPKGSRVTLWISPGVGTRSVRVPDVVGLSPDAARRQIRQAGLYVDSPRATGDRVLWQEPARGESLKEGEEVRIHTTPKSGVASPPAEPSRPAAPSRSSPAAAEPAPSEPAPSAPAEPESDGGDAPEPASDGADG